MRIQTCQRRWNPVETWHPSTSSAWRTFYWFGLRKNFALQGLHIFKCAINMCFDNFSNVYYQTMCGLCFIGFVHPYWIEYIINFKSEAHLSITLTWNLQNLLSAFFLRLVFLVLVVLFSIGLVCQANVPYCQFQSFNIETNLCWLKEQMTTKYTYYTSVLCRSVHWLYLFIQSKIVLC